MTKSFFIVVPYSPAMLSSNKKSGFSLSMFNKKTAKVASQEKLESFDENRSQLEQRLQVVEQGLVRCGIRVVQLGTEELVELYYKIFNPGDVEKPIPLTNQ